jgi:hypothetical protein
MRLNSYQALFMPLIDEIGFDEATLRVKEKSFALFGIDA